MTDAARNTALIRSRGAIAPRVGIVLGSGLGDFAAQLEEPVAIPYADLDGFPRPAVSGHSGQVVLGTVGGTPSPFLPVAATTTSTAAPTPCVRRWRP
jgi:purine nucleoside phosphorylase